jgi:hypothetical protein
VQGGTEEVVLLLGTYIFCLLYISFVGIRIYFVCCIYRFLEFVGCVYRLLEIQVTTPTLRKSKREVIRVVADRGLEAIR